MEGECQRGLDQVDLRAVEEEKMRVGDTRNTTVFEISPGSL